MERAKDETIHMEKQHQAKIFEAMKRPAFYPHPVTTIEERETHISKVFLTGDYAYKIKKSVNLDFLDFTNLKKRHHFCRQEVILNRRLAHSVYLGIVAITVKNDRYYINGPGEIVEYAVKMRQLPENLSLLRLVRRGELNDDSIDELARVLAKFHLQAHTAQTVNAIGSWQTVWTNTEENFRQTERFVGDLLDDHMFQIIRAATLAFLIRSKILFERRIAKKKIRDCHGDLRTGHIYLSDRIQIIDCIEFNDRFRYADVTSDLAYLAMDLDYEGYPQISQHLINSYLEYTKDEEMLVLLDFYKCYRAYVRVKVNCFRLLENDLETNKRAKLYRETHRYMNLAYRYAVQFTRPTIWVVCGLPASGKTTIAKELAKILNVKLLQSDVLRKKLFSLQPLDHRDLPFGEGIYSKEATSLTYGKLLLLAQEELEKSRSIILDATYGSQHHRDEVIRLARDLDANIIFFECIAPYQILKKRLSEREAATTASDARLHHLRQFRARFEPLSEIREELRLRVNTDMELDAIMRQILSHDYALLSKQTAGALKQWESSYLNVV
jgi:aminoglycoside phosphotransferase family enzyme/predicted kinase